MTEPEHSFSTMFDRRVEALAILSSFDEEEFSLNGHNKGDAEFLLRQYLELMDHILPGDYMEMGCGTGILCRFIHEFSDKRTVPHGIDVDLDKISIAKRNNPDIADNFMVADALDLIPNKMPRFSTVAIFVPNRKDRWKAFGKLALSIMEAGKANRVIFFLYDKDLSTGDDPEIASFLSEAGKNFKVAVANPNFITLDPV